MAIDWTATDKRVVKNLRRVLRPVQYRELFRNSLVGSIDGYGEKTDPAEKFRQHYSEHYHTSIVLIPGGDVGLRYWFPLAHQPQLVGREPLVVEGRCLVSYKAGYEHAKREPHLRDWFGDADTEQRFDRRMMAYQLESHVRDFFLSNWPSFCRPPSNHGRYERPAVDDFQIRLPDGCYKVDVKSASFSELMQEHYMVRRIHDVIYIAGKWDSKEEKAIVQGIVTGKWLQKAAGCSDGSFFTSRELMSFEILPVMLNMAKCGMSWRNAYLALQENRIKAQV